MYKEASKMKLRFSSKKGNLTVEQLWDLTMSDLKDIIINLYNSKQKPNLSELDFLQVVSEEDEISNLAYNIAVDVYKTRQKESEEYKNKLEKKAYNQHLADIIAEKEDAELRNKSIEELKAMLKD